MVTGVKHGFVQTSGRRITFDICQGKRVISAQTFSLSISALWAWVTLTHSDGPGVKPGNGQWTLQSWVWKFEGYILTLVK